ncbi:metal ABC transporter ATP-binding protein [Aureimonas frigidaquae]|uniref:metal ABC transporter ATP-binding protein n=1 Tax=Aureimonas frigidaquae TaxID=424757 RepID=UPI0007861E01|nr:ABC transporter ATP-binding protein [Aureimonas frigidaquae]
MTSPIITLTDLTLAYRRQPAVHHASGSFEAGSLTAVVGPNGAGKSTLLKGIMGLVRPSSGSVRLHGIDRRDIAYLPQIGDLDRSFPIDVQDLVALGTYRRMGLLRRIAGGSLEQVQAAIEAVGLGGFERRAISTLSGGQLQRALFARMLVQDARVLLLDEPFTAIDMRTTMDLLDVVARWHGEGRTIIAVLHDLELVQQHFPRSLLIAREVVAWGKTDTVVTRDKLHEARALSEHWVEDPYSRAAA